MKKFFLFFTVGSLLLISCNSKPKDQNDSTVKEEVTETVTTVVDDKHNAMNSLDYQGTYSGTIPAADCPGIKVVITLNPDNTYIKTSEFLETKEKPTKEEGKYTWNESGNIVTLQGAEAPNQCFVGENTLSLLDIEGNKMTGPNAESYILIKLN